MGKFLDFAIPTKYWRFRYRWKGHEQQLSFGVYPNVSLEMARNKALIAKAKLLEGENPNVRSVSHNGTFKDVSSLWFETQDYCSMHSRIVINRMEQYIYPVIGNHKLERIDSAILYSLLMTIQKTGKIETAHRIRTIVGQVFRYAISRGIAKYDPTYALKDALKSRKPQNMPAIVKRDDLRRLLLSIDGYKGYMPVQYALKIAPYIFARPGNLRSMEWSEVSFEERMWKVPASKMKSKQEHFFPLAHQVVTLLKELQQFTGVHQHCFPSPRKPEKCISDNTLLAALRTLGWSREEIVVHGFRTTASTLLHEEGWDSDIIEKQLAHQEQNKVRAAYNKALYLDKRREMMQFWADYLDQLKSPSQTSLFSVTK